LGRSAILALYRNPEYAGAHRSWQLLGDEEISRVVDESLKVWGRFRCIVTDAPEPPVEPRWEPLRFFR
jgi:hypothetical protein